MLNKSKIADLKLVPNPAGNSDQDKENRNIDQAIKEDSKGESYPEEVNDAQEREVFDRNKKEG